MVGSTSYAVWLWICIIGIAVCAYSFWKWNRKR